MATNDWQRLQVLFEAAAALPDGSRDKFLDRACEGDPEIRRRIEALLGAAGDGTEALEQAKGQAGGAVPSAGADLAPGSSVGRYEIVSSLGDGAMGQVFRARDTVLDRDVAIKLVNPTVLASASGRSRFEREARAAAGLKHRNIVTVHDVGEDGGRPFIVMELVDGETLRARMNAGCRPEEYLPWAIQIAAALATAHAAGIVHRDLKPENVIVDTEGEAQIVDFGLARLEGASKPLTREDLTLTQLTGAGMLMGTLGYMSPEAALGGATDHRTDQFALGAIVYELATGTRLLAGKTPQDVLRATLAYDPGDARGLDGLSPQLSAIIVRCLAKEPGHRYAETSELLEALEALASAPSARLNAPALPKPRTELIGREAERKAIRRLFIDEKIRLVTLTGPGGGGKTRLALQAAEDLLGEFQSRVFFVELGAIRDPDLVLPTIATALGAAGDRAPIDAIRSELMGLGSPTLVVLDNFEQVVSAARELGELLTKVESLSFLVTSREVLRIYGEYDFPVLPLAFPQGNLLPDLPEIERFPAVALFVARARAATASFELTAENAASVVDLCSRLDGLPLAVELAAARARTLSPQVMVERLENRKNLLSSGARDLPIRQQTLRATIDWSYELIDEPEKVLLRRLGSFVGGFTLESAEAVANGYGDLAVDVVDGIGSLVDKSLVQANEGAGEDSRFSLLETIREFALEKLADNDELDKTAKAHAAYFVLLAEEGGGALARDGDYTQWLETFQLEHDNCRAALDWLTANGHAEWGLRLALGLFGFWDRTGNLIEGQVRYSRLLALETSHEHRELRARGLFSAGTFAAARRFLNDSIVMQKEALELYVALGDLRGQAVLLNAIGINDSTDHFDHEGARKAFTEALDIWRELEDDIGYARSLSNLAWVLKTEGEHEEARRMYRQAGELFAAGGNAVDAAWAVNHEADVTAESGSLDEASELYGTALGLFEELDNPWGVATTLTDLAALAAKESDWKKAIRTAQRALEIFAELGHERGLARLFESLAIGALETGKPEVGLALVACAKSLRSRLGVQLSGDEGEALDRDLDRMRAATGKEVADRAWSEGATRTVEETVRLALDV